MKIKWHIEDGYAGGDRPHYTEIPDEDMEGMDQDAKEDYIDSWVQSEFEDKVSWSWKIVK